MSEWNLIHENFYTKHSVFTAPDAYMHTSFSYTLWSYNLYGSQQHRPRNRYASCVYTVSKLARQHRKRNSVHSPWTMCCSWKDQWLQLGHRRTENWRAVAHIPKERWQSGNAFVKRNRSTKSHCEPVWHTSWKHQTGRKRYKQQNSSSVTSRSAIAMMRSRGNWYSSDVNRSQSWWWKETVTREEVSRDGSQVGGSSTSGYPIALSRKKISIGSTTATLYHREQKNKPENSTCSRCFTKGHLASSCTNDIVCRTCKQPGHKSGHPSCHLPTDSNSSSTVVDRPQTSGTPVPAPDSGNVEPDQRKTTAATTTTTATLPPPATPLRPGSRRGRGST